MKKTAFIILLSFLKMIAFAQSEETGTDREVIKQYINNKVTDTMPAFSQTKNVKAIKNVLEEYNSTVGKLDVKSLATGAVLMSVSAVIVAINAGMLKVKDKS